MCLVFLGIEVDTENLELWLPLPELLRLQSTLTHWANLKCSKKRNLESLVGQLHDASIVVRPGCTFIRSTYLRHLTTALLTASSG